MDAQAFSAKQKEVAGQLAMLRAADKKPDLKISRDEIEASFVRDWAKQHPEDKGLAMLESYVRSAGVFREKVNAAYGAYQQARKQGTSVDPVTELHAVMAGTAVGVPGLPAQGEEPDKSAIAAKLRLLNKQAGKIMTVEAVQATVDEVSAGIRNTRVLEGNLERAVPGLQRMLDDNRAELDGLRTEQKRQRGNEAHAARERGRDAVDRNQVRQSLFGAIPPDVLQANPALRAQMEAIMEGNGSAKELRPEDLKRIQGNPNLSDATKKLLSQGADYGVIREQMTRDVEARIDAHMAANGERYAQRAQGQLESAAAKEYPEAVRTLLLQRQKLADTFGPNPNTVQQAALANFDQTIGAFVGSQERAREMIAGFAEQTKGPMANARKILSEPEAKPTGKENAYQLTPEQLATVAAMREQIANYSVEPNARPTAQGIIKAIEGARGR
jgi:hypothetical protein